MTQSKDIISISFKWDKTTTFITVLSLIVLIGAVIGLEFAPFKGSDIWIKIFIQIFLIASVLFAYSLMPVRLSVNPEQVTIKRPFNTLDIPMKDIVEIKSIQKQSLKNSIRTFGSGGLFGYLGYFYNKELGNYTMYTTETENLILIRTNIKKYVLSCTKSEEFIDYIKDKIPV